MRSLAIRNAVGRSLGTAVRDERGRVLLAAGTRLTEGLGEALLRRGFMQVVVQDGIADDVIPRDALTSRTRSIAQDSARQCFHSLDRGESLPLQTVLKAVDAILDDLAHTPGAILEFATLRSVSDYTYAHSVHVCVYSVMIGQGMGVVGADLRVLGTGALLHDVGKILCADITNRPGPLTDADWVRIRQHPIDGFEMLRQHHELHLFASHIAYQHHERLDGSGYPRGLREEKILPFARMVAVADVFDAMTADRPHATARPAREAMATLQDGAGRLFDSDSVRAFARRMAVYPTGTPVLLADGAIGVIVDQGADPQIPRVRLLGRGGHVYDRQDEVPALADHAVSEILVEWPAWLRARRPALRP